MDKGQLVFTSIMAIYLIGIAITYAIMENPEDKGPFEVAPIIAVSWPLMLLYYMYVTLAYPFYWITKKIINKLKH